MSRTAARIQAEIDILEAQLASTNSLLKAAGSDSTQATYHDRDMIEKRLDRLYQQLDRATGSVPMFTRGVVKGL